jgi:hypothetical protein
VRTVVHDLKEKQFSPYNISFQLDAVKLPLITSDLLTNDALFKNIQQSLVVLGFEFHQREPKCAEKQTVYKNILIMLRQLNIDKT